MCVPGRSWAARSDRPPSRQGRISSRPPGPLANFLYGALCETAIIVARDDDQKAAHRQAVGEIGRILDGLATN
jgi:hypothetical protein